tara:strand:- start:1775 stop:2188 length:414 start_codon:yes stop_codon:yes gene_type:complete
MLHKILNQLFEYSNHYIEVRNDPNLNMPGFSFIEHDINARFVPIILVNLNIIPKQIDVLAHVIAHEWGHHVLRHMSLVPPHSSEMPSPEERQEKENEADTYAALFIKEYCYNIKPIEAFILNCNFDCDNRINILNSV